MNNHKKFSQDNSNFYVLMSSKEGSNQGPWQAKRLNSETGPCPSGGNDGSGCGVGCGTDLSDAMRKDFDVVNQTEVLWRYPTSIGRSKRSSNVEDPSYDDLGDGKVIFVSLT